MKKTQLKVRGEVTGRRHSKETQEEVVGRRHIWKSEEEDTVRRPRKKL